jgi:hypothetical protein
MTRRMTFKPSTTVSRLDRRRHARVIGFYAHETAALGAQLADRGHKAREWMQPGAGGVGAEDEEVNLHIGRRQVGPGAQEGAGITGADGQQSLSRQSVAQAGAVAMAPVIDHVVHGDRLGAAVLHADLEMVLQIGADTRQVGDHIDAKLAQKFCRPEA